MRTAGSPAEASRSISRIATAISGCMRPRAWTLRDAGNGPVVTRSSSIFGMSFADGSGAESGIVDLRCAIAQRFRGIRGEEVGFCRGVPVPTPARPGSGSKGCRALAASQPLPGAPLGLVDYPQSDPAPSRPRRPSPRSSSSAQGEIAARPAASDKIYPLLKAISAIVTDRDAGSVLLREPPDHGGLWHLA